MAVCRQALILILGLIAPGAIHRTDPQPVIITVLLIFASLKPLSLDRPKSVIFATSCFACPMLGEGIGALTSIRFGVLRSR